MLWADEGIEGGSMQCRRCAGEQFVKAGRDRSGRQIYPCVTCDCRQTDRSTSAFCGYRFPDDVIALAVRWYLRFRLPYADLVELLAERGSHVDGSVRIRNAYGRWRASARSVTSLMAPMPPAAARTPRPSGPGTGGAARPGTLSRSGVGGSGNGRAVRRGPCRSGPLRQRSRSPASDSTAA